eukprot:8806290-Pyramimonas_sp.AAC.1
MEVEDLFVSKSASPQPSQSKRGKGGASKAGVRIYGTNCYTWSAASTLLDSLCGGQVWALLGQEHQLSHQWIPEILASTKKRGITLAMTKPAPGPHGGPSAGVYIAVPSAIGLAPLAGCKNFGHSPPGSPGRLCVAWAPIGGKGGMMLIGVYMWVSEGLSIGSLSLLDRIADIIHRLRIPWVPQGDFNVLPSELANSNWIDDIGGVPLATGLPTCQHTTGQRELDYYVVDQRIAPAFDPPQLYAEVSAPPHAPLVLTLRGSFRKAQ